MITYNIGDVIESPHELIFHGCNAQKKMGKGIAKRIREKYPYAYQRYMEDQIILGTNVYAFIGDEDRFICNMIIQQYYGNTPGHCYVSYDAIRTCFKHLNDFCEEVGIKSVAGPKIGTGLGGGDWSKIEEIIKSTMKVPVHIYELKESKV